MLLEFSVRNYRSFRDKHTLSLVAGAGEEHEETHTVRIPGSDERALRSAAIYGPNASGKTNLLLAIRAMRSIVINSAVSSQRGDEIKPIVPFRLSEEGRTSPTHFDISFISGEKEYEYGFSATRNRVKKEWLNSYSITAERRKSQGWFVRDYDPESEDYSYKFYERMKGEKKKIATSTRDNALFLSTAAQLNNDAIAPIFDWFQNSLRYLQGESVQSRTTAELCEDDSKREAVVEFLEAADVGIRGVSIDKKDKVFEEFSSPIGDLLDEVMDEYGIRDEVEEAASRKVRFEHSGEEGDSFFLDFGEESHGTQQFFALAGPVILTLSSGGVLVVDELDASLHSRMLEEIIGLFNNPNSNPEGAQLVFNLHDTSPFDSDVLRRDQIWLTEKFGDGSTTLTSLLEFSPRKKTEALEQNYRQGRYGGVPIPRIVEKAQSKQKSEISDE